jgi:cytochrome-b5 reductase
MDRGQQRQHNKHLYNGHFRLLSTLMLRSTPSLRNNPIRIITAIYTHIQRVQSTTTTTTGTSRRTMTTHQSTSTTTAFEFFLPSTMTGPPICKLVPPGICQIGPEPVALPLLHRWPVSPTSSVLRFGLPDTTLPLNLSTTACIVAVAKVPTAENDNGQEADDDDDEEEEIARKYSPISTNADVGYVDLLVKNYGAPGKMSRWMHEIIPGKDSLDFVHTPQNNKLQAPFVGNAILMIAGGTGIAPMIQALHAILGKPDNNAPLQKVVLLYGSRDAHDILGHELLRQWADDYSHQFAYIDILSHEPDDSDWRGLRGFIDEDLVQKHFPYDPKNDTDSSTTTTTTSSSTTSIIVQAMVCGPKPMYQAICGPKKNRNDITGVLGNLGFTADQVTKM